MPHFSSFLRDLFRQAWDAKLANPHLTLGKDVEVDLKAWDKNYLNTDEKARSLLEDFKDHQAKGLHRVVLAIEDLSGLWSLMVARLSLYIERATLVRGIYSNPQKSQLLSKRPASW